VKKLAAEIGGKTDILINTARFVRPGGVIGATRCLPERNGGECAGADAAGTGLRPGAWRRAPLMA
jgi:hypothetical protein